MNAANQRQLTPVLVVIAVLLGALLLVLLGGVGRAVFMGRAACAGATAAAGQPRRLAAAEAAAAIRAGLAEAAVQSGSQTGGAMPRTASSSLGDLELTGVILTGGLRMALLHDKNGDKQVRLHEGASSARWQHHPGRGPAALGGVRCALRPHRAEVAGRRADRRSQAGRHGQADAAVAGPGRADACGVGPARADRRCDRSGAGRRRLTASPAVSSAQDNDSGPPR